MHYDAILDTIASFDALRVNDITRKASTGTLPNAAGRSSTKQRRRYRRCTLSRVLRGIRKDLVPVYGTNVELSELWVVTMRVK